MNADRERRLAVMREGPVGAFGVAAVGLAVVIETVALSLAIDHGEGTVLILTAVAGSRLGVTWACTGGVPAARRDGLGAAVAGAVDRAWATSMTIVVGVVITVTARIADDDWHAAPHVCAGIAGAVAIAFVLRRAAQVRLGGITGDVLGAVVELGTVASLLAATVRL